MRQQIILHFILLFLTLSKQWKTPWISLLQYKTCWCMWRVIFYDKVNFFPSDLLLIKKNLQIQCNICTNKSSNYIGKQKPIIGRLNPPPPQWLKSRSCICGLCMPTTSLLKLLPLLSQKCSSAIYQSFK